MSKFKKWQFYKQAWRHGWVSKWFKPVGAHDIRGRQSSGTSLCPSFCTLGQRSVCRIGGEIPSERGIRAPEEVDLRVRLSWQAVKEGKE